MILDYYLRTFTDSNEYYAVKTKGIPFGSYNELIQWQQKKGYLKISEFCLLRNGKNAVIMDKFLYNRQVHYIYYHYTYINAEVGIYHHDSGCTFL